QTRWRRPSRYAATAMDMEQCPQPGPIGGDTRRKLDGMAASGVSAAIPSSAGTLWAMPAATRVPPPRLGPPPAPQREGDGARSSPSHIEGALVRDREDIGLPLRWPGTVPAVGPNRILESGG